MNRKNITLKTAAVFAFVMWISAGCKRELPYPIDDVVRTPTVDVSRVAGTTGVLTTGDPAAQMIKVRLQIPQIGEGSYQKLQLAAVYTSSGSTSVAVVKDDITGLKAGGDPTDVEFSLADVLASLGKSAVSSGEEISFTANIVLDDGATIYGYIEAIGKYSAGNITGWKVNGRNYSCRARYPVVCPLNLDDFVGTFSCEDEWWEDTYDVTVTKLSDTELQVTEFGGVDATIVIKVNFEDYTVSVMRTVLVPGNACWLSSNFCSYSDYAIGASNGTIDACQTIITLNVARYEFDGGAGWAGPFITTFKNKH